MEEAINFAIVLVCTIGVAGVVGILYATGIRMMSIAVVDETGIHNMLARIAAAFCFAICIIIVLFALCLIIPFLG